MCEIISKSSYKSHCHGKTQVASIPINKCFRLHKNPLLNATNWEQKCFFCPHKCQNQTYMISSGTWHHWHHTTPFIITHICLTHENMFKLEVNIGRCPAGQVWWLCVRSYSKSWINYKKRKTLMQPASKLNIKYGFSCNNNKQVCADCSVFCTVNQLSKYNA